MWHTLFSTSSALLTPPERLDRYPVHPAKRPNRIAPTARPALSARSSVWLRFTIHVESEVGAEFLGSLLHGLSALS